MAELNINELSEWQLNYEIMIIIDLEMEMTQRISLGQLVWSMKRFTVWKEQHALHGVGG